MVVQHKIGDLFDSNADVIVHQVNCRGVMGSGVAKQVKARFPETFRKYVHVCETFERYFSLDKLLGRALLTSESFNGRRVYIANLFAQKNYGRDGKCYTHYGAFREALRSAASQISPLGKLKVAMPYRIGCDRGGGDWNTVLSIIEQEFGDFDVTLYELTQEKKGEL